MTLLSRWPADDNYHPINVAPSERDLDIVCAESELVRQTSSDWIQTFCGKRFYPFDPRPEEVFIRDIAHALSLINRFTGHTREGMSVAQHCVHVSQVCDPRDAKWGLLHDASEAYMQDLSRPIKHRPEMKFYRDAEQRVLEVIAERFGLKMPIPLSVHQADRRMLLTERRDLMRHLEWTSKQCEDWDLGSNGPFTWKVTAWAPKHAEAMFLDTFQRLFDGE